ncbi:unnamed protein product [Effrenium voratum]|uniref:Uncharacterized protein n=1 Tax=Effrenium voratum TaxID=2562239 RepID=A0AA36JKJ4_9DINO|nr:unnamed protein product [Effrenium voratum]
MWARRLGVPHLWPSRVKVFFLAILTSVFNFSVFQYLHNANVAYLNLAAPLSEEIVCKLPREECASNPDPASCTVDLEDRRFWRGLNLTTPCPKLPDSLQGQTCRNPRLPLRAISGDLGSLHTVNVGVHPFRLWSILFLILTSLLSLSILIHDLALLEENQRPYILSIPNMKYATPCLWDCLTCVRGRQRTRHIWSQNRCFLAVLVMLWSVFQAGAFMIVMYPFSLLVCIYAPVKMSRIMVFLSSILCALWSVVFILTTSLLDNQPYAVLWGISESSVNCLCLCEFPLSRPVVLRVVVLGTGVCWHAINLTLRALKGLRRAQWANMFSVLYSVPVEAFPVIWERPEEAGAGPIRWRQEGEAVQSEPAFDPFCLMDEQPESAWTRAIIAPVPVKDDSRLTVWEPYLGTLDMEIGWCGFPRPVGGAWEKDCADRESDGPESAQPELQVSQVCSESTSTMSRSSQGEGWPRKVKKRPPPMRHLETEAEVSDDDALRGTHDWEEAGGESRPSSCLHYSRRLSDAQGIFHTGDRRPTTPASEPNSASRQHSPSEQGLLAATIGRRLSTPVGQDRNRPTRRLEEAMNHGRPFLV